MNSYIIIRSDTKSISPPMPKQEAIKKLKQYGKEGISSYIVSNCKNLEFDLLNRRNL